MTAPTIAGSLAARKEFFGPFSRYAVAPVNDRWGGVSWFVWDAEVADDFTGGPAVIRQAGTKEEAVAGLS